MNYSVKSFTSIQESTVDSTTVVDIVVDGFPQTENGMRGRVMTFESELTWISGQKVGEGDFERVLENFGKNGRNGDSPIIVGVTQITLSVFNERNYVAKLELLWNERVVHHFVQ